MNLTQEYLNKEVNFGGVKTTLGKVVNTLRSEGIPQKYIDAYLQGALTAEEIQSLTEWKVVVIDHTEHWNPDIVKLGGKIFAVYFFDPGKSVQLCEMTPSFELKFITYESTEYPDNESDADLLDDALMYSSSNDDIHMHCTDVTPIQVGTGCKISQFNEDEIRDDLLHNGLPEAAQKLIK